MGNRINVFHWHGDTFDLPESAIHLASSACTKNQAYIYKNKVLALQFHLEPTLDSLMQMIEGGRDELKKGKYIQTEKDMLRNKRLIDPGREILFTLLSRLAEQF
jgi:GMP synthase (glutamine-hydrolysing)